MEEDIRKWRDRLFLDRQNQYCQNGYTFNITYKFNTIPVKTPTAFFIGLETVLKFMQKQKRKAEGGTVLGLKVYYVAAVIKMVWFWYKSRHDNQWNTIEDAEKSPSHPTVRSLRKGPKTYTGGKTASLVNHVRQI